MLSPHPLCRFSALIRECLFASAAARLLSLAVTPSALPAAQRIGRPAGAELVGSLGLLKVPARDLKRALEEAAAVRADPPHPTRAARAQNTRTLRGGAMAAAATGGELRWRIAGATDRQCGGCEGWAPPCPYAAALKSA